MILVNSLVLGVVDEETLPENAGQRSGLPRSKRGRMADDDVTIVTVVSAGAVGIIPRFGLDSRVLGRTIEAFGS